MSISKKRAKFVELANNRVNRAVKDMRLIGNLSNKSAYEFTEDDVRRIHRVLSRELESMRLRFNARGGSADGEFSLEG